MTVPGFGLPLSEAVSVRATAPVLAPPRTPPSLLLSLGVEAMLTVRWVANSWRQR